jgi:hypothetical protein
VSPRPHLRLGLAALAVAALAACYDSSTQPQQQIDSGPPPNLSVSTSCKATEIYQIITWLTPLRNAPLDLRGTATVVLTFSTYKQALAQSLVMQFAAAMTPTVIAKLNTPPNPPYATKEAAVAVLITDLMQCVGIAPTQAPPPEAYLPSGGLKVIDNSGGTVYAGDKEAVMDVPAGAVTGPHLFAIAVVPPAGEVPTRCLPYRADVIEVGRCYDFSVTPDVGAKVDGQGFGGDGIFAAACSPGVDGDEVHTYLQLAKVDHTSPETFTIYPRVQRSAITGSMACDLGSGPPTPTASLMGGAWSKVRFALSVLARPFAPNVANASDGVGSLFADLTHASLVYRKRPLTVTPSSATVTTGGSQGFTAAPADGEPARGGQYVWSVNGMDVGSDAFSPIFGTLSVGGDRAATFTAPAVLPTPATFDVCVRRATAPADKGCAPVTIQAQPVLGTAILIGDFDVFSADAAAYTSNNAKFYGNFGTFASTGPRATQTGAVWYEGHGSAMPTHRGRFPGIYGEMEALGAALTGYSFSISATTSLASVPANVKLLFLVVPATTFSYEEAAGLRSFISEGGRLVVVSDNAGFYSAYQTTNEALNDLLYKLGAAARDLGDGVDCGYVSIPATSLRAHQLTIDASSGGLLSNVEIACATDFSLGANDHAFMYSSANSVPLGAEVALSAVAPSPSLITARPMLRSMSARPSISASAGSSLRNMAVGGGAVGSTAPAGRGKARMLKP